jgi:N-acetylneuraminic acid mutarotase
VTDREHARRLLLAGIAVLGVLAAATIVLGVKQAVWPSHAGNVAGPWRTQATLDTPRDDFGTVVVGGRIWVVGGMTGERAHKLASVEVYDPRANSWSAGPTMPVGRSSVGAARVGDVVYVIGGSAQSGDRVQVSDATAALDTRTRTWTRLPPMPTPRYELAAVAVGSKVYAIGGDGGNGPVRTVEVYDTRTRRWSTGPALPKARASLRAVLLDGRIYAVGGLAGDADSADVQVLDVATGRWSAGPALPAPLSNFGLTTYDGRLHALRHGDHFTYRPGDRAWQRAPAMPTRRHGEGVAAVDGRMYVVGGCSESPLRDLNVVESYAGAAR